MRVKHFEENLLGTDYVVGDIHGCFSKLRCALAMMDFDETKDRLFAVGDLVDRGPDSEEAIDWIAKPWFHSVRGNHDQMAIDWAAGYADDVYVANGGGWFVNMKPSRQKFIAQVFSELPIAIDVKVGGKLYGIVHADTVFGDWNVLIDRLENPDCTHNSESIEQAAMWDRSRFTRKDDSTVKNVELVYVGHTPTKQIVKLGNVIYIDTGAVFKNGSMTIVNISKENV